MGGAMISGPKVSFRLLPSLMITGLIIIASGCMRPYGVPAYSQLVAEAPGQMASFQAPDDGTVYVDGPGKSSRHIVYSGLIRRGEIVTVDPQNERLIVNGKPADVTIVGGRSFYQVWYAPAHNELLGY
jgi:hypothetical protein